MKKLLIIACMMHAGFLSDSCTIDAQILENISVQKSEYEFLKHSIENYDIYMIALNRYENDENYRQLSLAHLNVIFEKILEQIAEFRRKNPDKYISMSFSESFCGSNPFTDVQFIVDKYSHPP